MNNALSPILLAIEDAFENQKGSNRSWTPGTKVVVETDDNGQEIWWVKHVGKGKLLTPEQIEALLDEELIENEGKPVKKRFGRTSEYAVGINYTALTERVQALETIVSKAQILQRRNKDLERQLKVARDSNAGDRAMADLINTMKEAFRIKSPLPPLKFDRTKPSKTQALAGVPTLMLSDWHWGEVVDPRQIQGLNEFNLDIANKRADRVFSKTLELLFHHQAGQSYDGFTLILGGDMFSGNIHEELRVTNDAPIHECLLSLAEKLANGIIGFAKQFRWVYVPGVVGNHGRIDRKPTAKYAVKDNYDWLLYQFVMMLVQGRMGDKCNVQFDISTALDLPFRLYDTRYLLTHGDQIRGGSGVGGFWPSMMKTAHRKQQRSVKGGIGGFDYMVCGHFHKYGSVSNVIVNGSLKGYDEWVYKMNFEWERPIQALWTTHPEHGIISHVPVYADDTPDLPTAAIAPVTPSWDMNARALRRG